MVKGRDTAVAMLDAMIDRFATCEWTLAGLEDALFGFGEAQEHQAGPGAGPGPGRRHRPDRRPAAARVPGAPRPRRAPSPASAPPLELDAV